MFNRNSDRLKIPLLFAAFVVYLGLLAVTGLDGVAALALALGVAAVGFTAVAATHAGDPWFYWRHRDGDRGAR